MAQAEIRARATPRHVWADDLKVWLVVGVIAAHAVAAWTAQEGWVLEEPPVREPLLTFLNLASLVGVLFGMATFFLVAGMFTPASLARKGCRRFAVDRLVRLGVPLLFFLVVMAPVVEFAADDVDWDRGFPAFVVHTWQHPAPGPTWFLEVLLLFSLGYAALRAVRPRPAAGPGSPTVGHVVAAITAVGLVSFVVRLVVPFASERDDIPGLNDLYLAQAPAWLAGFVLGVVGAERGWFGRLPPRLSAWLFRVAWSAVAALVVVVVVTVGILGADVTVFYGGWRWQSLVFALLEGAVAVAMPLWLCDVFRRRVRSHGRLMTVSGRAAYGAFLVHQVVLVGAVLATRLVAWPPEVEFLAATTLAVAGSFGCAALLTRVAGVARVL
jgi:peptidoglycan/LPS O-acetylase OafA/YrhL